MCSSANHAKANRCPPFDLDKGWEDVLRDAGLPWKARVRRLRRFVRRCSARHR
jgi:hypothetical protein